jgi:hypothetical protein
LEIANIAGIAKDCQDWKGKSLPRINADQGNGSGKLHTYFNSSRLTEGQQLNN